MRKQSHTHRNVSRNEISIERAKQMNNRDYHDVYVKLIVWRKMSRNGIEWRPKAITGYWERDKVRVCSQIYLWTKKKKCRLKCSFFSVQWETACVYVTVGVKMNFNRLFYFAQFLSLGFSTTFFAHSHSLSLFFLMCDLTLMPSDSHFKNRTISCVSHR